MIQDGLINGVSIRYTSVPVQNLSKLEEWWQNSIQKANNDKVFRSYIEGHTFLLPPKYSWAKSVIVVALEYSPRLLPFIYNGKSYSIWQLPSYYENSISRNDIKKYLETKICDTDTKIEDMYSLPLKLLASSCGLGQYGKNAIVYVDKLGTAHSLMTFLTNGNTSSIGSVPNAPIFKENFTGPSVLKMCSTCSICENLCPTHAISNEALKSDVCISLWNEIDNGKPSTIPLNAHNSIMGCNICQKNCPQNKGYYEPKTILPELSHSEMTMLLASEWNDDTKRIMANISSTDDSEYLQYMLPIFSRNIMLYMKGQGIL